MPYIMGIDQGGTKTDIVIADDQGNILSAANDRDWTPVQGERRAVRMLRIRYAAEKAAAEAGISLGGIDRVSGSCNGADWPFEYPIGRKNIRNTLGVQQVRLYNDCIGALRGGTEVRGRDCAVLCLGTGGNCAVFNREGEEYIYAYYLKSIHQGAGAIGRFVFEAVFDAQAGLAPPTALTGLLLEATGYASVEDLFIAVTTGPTEDAKPWTPVYKQFSPLLFQGVGRGDPVSLQYLENFCQGLARYVIVAAKKLGMQQRDIMVVLSGGVLKSGSIMVELIQKNLALALPGARCVNAEFEPVVGALLMEYDQIYPDGVPEQVMQRLRASCVEHNLYRSVFQGLVEESYN